MDEIKKGMIVMGKFEREFVRYMDAGVPILYIDTFEDNKAGEMIRKLCQQSNRNVTEWNLTKIVEWNWNSEEKMTHCEAQPLAAMLQNFLNSPQECENRVIVLMDSHLVLGRPGDISPDNAKVISCLKQLAQGIHDGKYDGCNICILSPFTIIPKELELYTTVMEMDLLGEDEIRKIVNDFTDAQGIERTEQDLLDNLVTRLKGLSRTEIDNILSLAISEHGMLTYADLPLVLEQKQQMIKKSGILEMISVTESMEDIGGLENLKKWLERKAEIFRQLKKAKDFGVDIPKGLLIVGMPGCGKSLTAKAASKAFEMPLLRMDMGRLMGKYVGESEANMRRAIHLTDASSPCILWIDEMEKAFAGIGAGNSGSEVTTRLFGNFLTWMQEKKSLAFVVATANKIDKLPPELLRKGRFDEIFYVDLPKESERKKILELHLKKRRKNFADDNVNFQELAMKTDGYCGADLEGIIRDGIEQAFVEKKEKVSTYDILDAIKETHSLSEIMKDSIDEMAKIYKKRKFKNASA